MSKHNPIARGKQDRRLSSRITHRALHKRAERVLNRKLARMEVVADTLAHWEHASCKYPSGQVDEIMAATGHSLELRRRP
jgi:hypothetical protein